VTVVIVRAARMRRRQHQRARAFAGHHCTRPTPSARATQDLSPLVQEEEEPWLPRGHRRHAGRQQQQRPPLPSGADAAAALDYKAIDSLLGVVGPSGRIKPRRQTRMPRALQRRAARSIKFARAMALLPYDMRVGHDADSERWTRQRSMAAALAAAAREEQGGGAVGA
jgi:ribosomal protein S18